MTEKLHTIRPVEKTGGLQKKTSLAHLVTVTKIQRDGKRLKPFHKGTLYNLKHLIYE